MKLVIASDIHGSAYYCRKLLERLEEEKEDRLILLGDVLYHGPRNDLPKDYAPKEDIAMMNPKKEKILCVSGTGIPDSGGLWIFIRKRTHDFPDPRTCIQ